MSYSAILQAPFGQLGVLCQQDQLVKIDFLLQLQTLKPAAVGSLAAEVAAQLEAYYADPRFVFQLPYQLQGTTHQQQVWQHIANIPCGQTTYYQDIAQQLNSSARAVGTACGHNPLPIIIPCHRVLAKTGPGGFARSTGQQTLNIKAWLLGHEYGC